MASKHNLLFLLEIRDNKRLIHTHYNFSISPWYFDSFGLAKSLRSLFSFVYEIASVNLVSVQDTLNEDTAFCTTSMKRLTIF